MKLLLFFVFVSVLMISKLEAEDKLHRSDQGLVQSLLDYKVSHKKNGPLLGFPAILNKYCSEVFSAENNVEGKNCTGVSRNETLIGVLDMNNKVESLKTRIVNCTCDGADSFQIVPGNNGRLIFTLRKRKTLFEVTGLWMRGHKSVKRT